MKVEKTAKNRYVSVLQGIPKRDGLTLLLCLLLPSLPQQNHEVLRGLHRRIFMVQDYGTVVKCMGPAAELI